MPFEMSNLIQAIMIGGIVYVGGGYSFKNQQTVMVYTPHISGSWITLPPFESRWFGMAAVNNELVLVGGAHPSTGEATNVLRVWNDGSQLWTHPFPALPSPRCKVSVISYHKWLIVTGGYNDIGPYIAKVEILDTCSGQWYEAAPLPSGCIEMSSAINGNMWYLSRGLSSQRPNKYTFSVCLDELISQAVLQSAGVTSPSTPQAHHGRPYLTLHWKSPLS